MNLVVSGGLFILVRATKSRIPNAALRKTISNVLLIGAVCLTVIAFFIIAIGPIAVSIYSEKWMPL